MKIKLSNSKEYAIVDDEDYERVSRYTWRMCRAGYASRTQHKNLGKPNHTHNTLHLHRSLLGDKEDCQIDHVNRNRLDNRRKNLRHVPVWANRVNRIYPNKTGYRGVKKESGKTFSAKVRKDRVDYSLSGFKTAEEAALGYNQLAKEHHGEYAMLNVV